MHRNPTNFFAITDVLILKHNKNRKWDSFSKKGRIKKALPFIFSILMKLLLQNTILGDYETFDSSNKLVLLTTMKNLIYSHICKMAKLNVLSYHQFPESIILIKKD